MSEVRFQSVGAVIKGRQHRVLLLALAFPRGRFEVVVGAHQFKTYVSAVF
jgi:hypothetical protein